MRRLAIILALAMWTGAAPAVHAVEEAAYVDEPQVYRLGNEHGQTVLVICTARGTSEADGVDLACQVGDTWWNLETPGAGPVPAFAWWNLSSWTQAAPAGVAFWLGGMTKPAMACATARVFYDQPTGPHHEVAGQECTEVNI
jgi:hypothetical protein